MSKIFVVADTHFGHLNMQKYENRPPDFDERIIYNWNGLVEEGDLVIHLGDVILGKEKETRLPLIMKRLNGRKILTLGNHDHESQEYYMDNGFDFVCDYFVYKDIAFSHYPLTPLPFQNGENHPAKISYNLHGHFHRGMHRVEEKNIGIHDDFYNYTYYKRWKNRYKLVQIEDELRPFALEELV